MSVLARLVVVTLVFAVSATLVASGGATSSAPTAVSFGLAATPKVAVAGTLQVPPGIAPLAIPRDVLASPDGRHIYVVTTTDVRQIDLWSLSLVKVIALTSPPLGGVATNASGTLAYIPTNGPNGSLEILDLVIGELQGPPIDMKFGRSYRTDIALHEADAQVTAYVYDSGDLAAGVPAAIHVIDITRNPPVSSTNYLTSRPRGQHGRIALSSDGSHLYLADPVTSPASGILVFDTSDLLEDPTALVLGETEIKGNFVQVASPTGSTQGLLHVVDAANAVLRVHDLDAANAVVKSVDLSDNGVGGTDVRSLFLDQSGNAAIGFDQATMVVVAVDGTTSVRTGFADSVGQAQVNAGGILIDPNQIGGSCVFTANNSAHSVSAFSIDGARCGAFGPWIGGLPERLAINETATVSLAPPLPAESEDPWVGVGIFVDKALIRTVTPPFASSITIDWADLPPGLTVEIRSFSQAQLDDAGLDSVADVDDATSYTRSAFAQLGYLALEADQVVVGDGFTCALQDGSVLCLGDNWGGQLGDGSNNDSLRLRRVSPGPDGFTNTAVTEISAGDYHMCALEAGSVYCWGANWSGQVGDGSMSDRSLATKVMVSGGFMNSGVTDFAAGSEHTCAVEAGSVYCWGYNGSGELGDGTTVDRPMPVKVGVSGGFTNAGVTAVSAAYHTCVLQHRELFCWGGNGAGQLGDGSQIDRNSPIKVAVGGGFTNTDVSVVGAGWLHTCAVESGVAYCWGNGGNGRLGSSSTANVSTPTKVHTGTQGFTNTAVTEVALGWAHTCAVEGEALYCWGSNDNGRLGDGSTEDRSLPVKVGQGHPDFSNSGVMTVSAGDHTCAVDNRHTYCWGKNLSGQLGVGTTGGLFSAPAPVFNNGFFVIAKVPPAPPEANPSGTGSGTASDSEPDAVDWRQVPAEPAGSIAPVLTTDGLLPRLSPGQVQVSEDGGEVAVEVLVEDETTVVMRGQNFSLRISGDCPGGCSMLNSVDGTPVLVLRTGANIIVEGQGFDPETAVYVWLFSEPTLLGGAKVGEQGSFISVLSLGDTAAGEHTVQVNGQSAQGLQRTVNLGVIVKGDAVVDRLPMTGRDFSLMVVGGVMLLAGGVGLALGVRSRRRYTTLPR
jgi:alpha-tubulin suppressor-like RCC1 family protein